LRSVFIGMFAALALPLPVFATAPVSSGNLEFPVETAAIVEATTNYDDQAVIAKVSRGLGEAMVGINLDDLDDYRPGRQAAMELKIRSPLLEAGMAKDDIRTLSRRSGLTTADKQPFACLASRFPYGTRITAERLKQIDRCETFMRENGFHTFRVRYHGDTARIEVGLDELGRIIDDEMRGKILTEFKDAGFTYVALDLQGYRTGSMNEGTALNNI